MPDDAVFDQRLRRAAQAALDAHAAAVDVDAEFDALRTHIAGQPTVVPLVRARPNRARLLGAAAAALIVVAGVVAIAWSRGGDRTDIVAPPPASDVSVTTAPPASVAPGTTVPVTTVVPIPAAAIAKPDVVVAGEVVTITPAGTIERMCLDVVTLIRIEDDGPGGQIIDGEWRAAPDDDVTTMTYPACQGAMSDSAVSLLVPAEVPAGRYEMCLTEPGNPIGCARVTVQAPPAQPQACLTEPRTPPSLVDGTPPGEATIEPRGDGRAARWGTADAPNVVYQGLDAVVDSSWLDEAIADGRAITNGAYQAVAIPVSDPPLGGISIYIRDTGDGCLRHYAVGPGLLVDEAQTVTRQWVDALASGEPPPAPGHVELDVGYFGRRYADTPNVAIDQFSADGSPVATLTDDEVERLFPHLTLADGSTITLEGDADFGRCVNQPLTRVSGVSSEPLHSDLREARSIGVASTGAVIAGRDVCPAGTRWGDPGTRWELVALDPAAPASEPEILLIRESDPSQIQFQDGEVVIAMGEMLVEDFSPDGRYVALRDLFHTEKSKWHVLDLENPGQTLPIESTCELAGDIVGPPRFVGNGIVVVARLCAALHIGDGSPYEQIGTGDVQVEAIDLTATMPSDRIVWHGSVPGLDADGYTRTVELTAMRDDDDAVWALLTGGGGVELSSRTFALHGSDAVEITRVGYWMFAFDPADLINPWDELPA